MVEYSHGSRKNLTSREKDVEKAEKLINEMADQGWILQQIATPDDGVGAMVGVFYKERKL